MKRASSSPIPEFAPDPQLRHPLYRQLRDWLRREILGGGLPAGSKLPSTRALAARLRISRNTVVNAYDALASDGLIGGTVGSGTRVRGNARRPKPLDLRSATRGSHFPAEASHFRDSEGNALYFHR